MLKIYRGWGPMYGMGEPVQISNTVDMPVPVTEEEAGDTRSAEEKRLIKELRKKEEELQTMEAEHKFELERRVNEEAEAKLKQFLVRRNDTLERERTEIIEQAKKEASDITADAKVTTMTVIKKAESESLKLREEARREGQEQGYAEGKAEALEKYNKYIDAAGKLLSEINSRKEAYYISNEEEMRETVFELVRKVIGAELKADPQIIDGIIGEAAKNFRNSDYIKITLPDDEISERYVTDRNLMRDIIPYIPEIEIEFDGEAEEGTVIIDNGSEIVDAGIPTQLDFLREILRNTRGESTEDEAEFMEEIKGRANRRKSITISADDEAADRVADRAADRVADRAETAEMMEIETAAAAEIVTEAMEMAAEVETAAETLAEIEPEPVPAVEPVIPEPEPVPEMTAEPVIPEPEPVVEMAAEAAVEPEPIAEPEPITVTESEPITAAEPEPVIEEPKPAAKSKPRASRSRKKAAEPKADPEAAAEVIAEPVIPEPEPEPVTEIDDEPVIPVPEPFSEVMLNAAADLADAAEALGMTDVFGTAEAKATEEAEIEQLTME